LIAILNKINLLIFLFLKFLVIKLLYKKYKYQIFLTLVLLHQKRSSPYKKVLYVIAWELLDAIRGTVYLITIYRIKSQINFYDFIWTRLLHIYKTSRNNERACTEKWSRCLLFWYHAWSWTMKCIPLIAKNSPDRQGKSWVLPDFSIEIIHRAFASLIAFL